MRYVLEYQEKQFSLSGFYEYNYNWSIYKYDDLERAIINCDRLNHDYPTANYRVWDTAENKVAYPEVKE